MSFWDDLGRGALAVGTFGISEGFQPGGVFNPKEPTRPNYGQAAEQQAASSATNVGAQTAANRPNQTNAFGSKTNWVQDANGNWHTEQGFSDHNKGVIQDLQYQMAGQFGQPLMTGDAARKQAIDAMYGQSTSRLNPMWDQRESQLKTQLANQGLDSTSEAYAKALEGFGRDRNDAYSSAMNGAIGMGNQAQQMTFDQNMQARMNPLQSLLGMQGLLQTPGFMGAGAADPTQYLSAAIGQGNYDLGIYNGKLQQGSDILGGATQLVGSPMRKG